MVSMKHMMDREVLLSDIVPAILLLLNYFKKLLEGQVGIQSSSKIDPASNRYSSSYKLPFSRDPASEMLCLVLGRSSQPLS